VKHVSSTTICGIIWKVIIVIMLWNAARIARHSQAFAASRMRLTTLRCALKAPCPAHNSRSYELLWGDAFCHILSYSVPGPASTSLDNRSSVSNSPYCPCTRGVMPRTSTLHELLCPLSFKMFKIQDTHSQHNQHTLSIQAVLRVSLSITGQQGQVIGNEPMAMFVRHL
jgi:hypothetical protein